MGQYNASGIKVLDRAVSIMMTVADKPCNLAELCEATSLPRATTHRLATALEAHRILTRTSDNRWTIGPTLVTLSAGGKNQLIDAAIPIMSALKDTTRESVQLYQLTGTLRTCIAAQEPPAGLQNTVPVGTQMPLTAGSAARVFLAYASPELREVILPKASFSPDDLALVRTTGWAESIAEREAGLASVSAPVFDQAGGLIAVLSVSGAAARLRPSPGAKWGAQLVAAAEKLSEAM